MKYILFVILLAGCTHPDPQANERELNQKIGKARADQIECEVLIVGFMNEHFRQTKDGQERAEKYCEEQFPLPKEGEQ